MPAANVPPEFRALCRPVTLFSGPGLNCPRHPSELYEAACEGILLFLLLFEPLSNAAKKSALQHVLILGLILRKWRQENPTECDDWIEQAWTLQPLYDAIKDASA